MQEIQHEVTEWRRSSRCGDTNCVEVARTSIGFAVRDSKNPALTPLSLSTEQWRTFVAGIHAGDFDSPQRE
jgi:hypothetical protein